jgi:hypothetical protein
MQFIRGVAQKVIDPPHRVGQGVELFKCRRFRHDFHFSRVLAFGNIIVIF